MPHSDGLLVVVSGPAGSGKSTLVENLIKKHPECACRAITATTRSPRPGEQNEIDYFFLEHDEFTDMIEANEFVEHTTFNGNLYGTPKHSLQTELAKNRVVLLVIEVEGAEAVKALFPQALFIFIVPPTPTELRNRLVKRGTESRQDIENRLAIARREMGRLGDYDYLVINGNVETATHDLAAIVRAVDRCQIVGGELRQWDAGAFTDWNTRHLL